MKYTTFEKLEQELAIRNAEIATLKAELRAISVALNDPRTDLTLTMVEVITELHDQVTLLRDALWKIAHPIDAMQSKLREGEKLNGPMAVMLASDPSYLKEIAQKALAATEPK